MHYYGPWVQQQSLLDNHWYYPQYVDEVYSFRQRNERPEEGSEQTVDETHDTITSATSSELFRLEFAAAHWSKLVSNAEGLFNKLMTSNILPHSEQDQIEQWLCMKQEYEECITSDENVSLQGFTENARRSLERIEEETDESFHRHEFENGSESCSGIESELSEEEEEQSDTDSENPDFLDRLDDYMNKFKEETDRLVDLKKDKFNENKTDVVPLVPRFVNNNNEFVPIIKPIPIRNTNSRRNSILPGSEMCNEIMAFNDSLKNSQNQNYQYDAFEKFKIVESTSYNSLLNREIELQNISEEDNAGFHSICPDFHNDNSPDLLIDALKNAEYSDPVKALKAFTMKNEVKQSHVKQIQTDSDDAHIHIEELQISARKEQYTAAKNFEARIGIKQRFQQKRGKVEEQYYDAKMQHSSLYDNSKDKCSRKKKSEATKSTSLQCKDNPEEEIISVAKIISDSKKHKHLKKDERKKQKEDQRKMSKQIEERSNLAMLKLKEIPSESEDDRNSVKLKSSKKKRDSLKVSTIMSQLDNVLKEKSTTMRRTAEEMEDLRNEIRNLRRTRDRLMDEKCALDDKLKLELILSNDEMRKMLECGEIIEAIDAVIERKNEMICGRKDFDEYRAQREKGTQMLMERLSKLTEGEMKTLFYKYFLKVIDLKESTKILERQADELEASYNTRIQELQMSMQKKLKQIVQYTYWHFASKEGGASDHDKLKLSKYKKENRHLKQQLANVEALLTGAVVPRTTSPPRIPRQELKQSGSNSGATTTVTLERNKMVIRRTMNCDKMKK